MSKVILVRHSVTDANQRGEIRSWHDLPLNREGIQAAEVARDKLARENIFQILSSDLMRALQTAEIIAFNRGLRVQPNRDLRTIDEGIYTGKLFEEVKDKIMWHKTHPTVPFPQGESFAQFLKRWSRILLRTLEWAEKNPLKITLLVTHERNFLTVPWVLSRGKVDFPLTDGIEPGDIKTLTKRGDSWEYKDYGI